MAADPQDRDYIEIQTHPLIDAFISSAEKLGFSLRKVDCEKAPVAFRKRLPFVQEFEFKRDCDTGKTNCDLAYSSNLKLRRFNRVTLHM